MKYDILEHFGTLRNYKITNGGNYNVWIDTGFRQ